jgi:hypothetical protein
MAKIGVPKFDVRKIGVPKIRYANFDRQKTGGKGRTAKIFWQSS